MLLLPSFSQPLLTDVLLELNDLVALRLRTLLEFENLLLSTIKLFAEETCLSIVDVSDLLVLFLQLIIFSFELQISVLQQTHLLLELCQLLLLFSLLHLCLRTQA